MARARKPVEFVSNVPADAPAAWAYRSSAAARRRRAPAPAAPARIVPKVPTAPPEARRSSRRPPRRAAPPPPAATVSGPRGSVLQRALALALLPFAAVVIMVRSPRP